MDADPETYLQKLSEHIVKGKGSIVAVSPSPLCLSSLQLGCLLTSSVPSSVFRASGRRVWTW
jgi:hypothetical protein